MSDNILVIPKVSIIIPIYNTAPFLRETLDSICNQSLKELDIILIFDTYLVRYLCHCITIFK